MLVGRTGATVPSGTATRRHTTLPANDLTKQLHAIALRSRCRLPLRERAACYSSRVATTPSAAASALAAQGFVISQAHGHRSATHAEPRHGGPDSRADHGHNHAGAAAANGRNLLLVLSLTTAYLVAEVVGGLFTGSLALLADAGHMFTDALGLVMALVAVRVAQRPATLTKTYGFYRAEVLASAANALVLLGIGGFILYEAWARWADPHPVDSLPMLTIAVGGLIVNLIGAWVLHAGAAHNLNVRGAYLEVVADGLGSLGAIAAAVIIFFTGWTPIDALVSALIGLLILPRTWSLLRGALDVLLESTPSHIDVTAISTAMGEVPGVASVHDIHVWTITSGFIAMSGHVQARGRRSGDVLHELQSLLVDRFHIEHVTLQVEGDDHIDAGACCVVDPRCLPVGARPTAHLTTPAL